MPKAPAFQFYVKQYVADNVVQAMEWEARGMYVHLLCMAWQENPPGSIPNDDVVIRRWLMLSPSAAGMCQRTGLEADRSFYPSGCQCSDCVWRRVRPQIMSAFSLRDGRWYQSGLCETWERMVKRSGASTNNVRKRYQHHVVVEEEEISNKVLEIKISEIYKHYPRKEGRGAAFKAIGAALARLSKGHDSPGELFNSIDDAAVYLVQRVKLFSSTPTGQAGKFTPHPATWFNQKRYLDDESEWSRNGGEITPNHRTATQSAFIQSGEAFARSRAKHTGNGFGASSSHNGSRDERTGNGLLGPGTRTRAAGAN